MQIIYSGNGGVAYLNFDEKIKLKARGNGDIAERTAAEIINSHEGRFLKKEIASANVPREDLDAVFLLAWELLNPKDDDKLLQEYRDERKKMISCSIENATRGKKYFIPSGAVNFLCGEYKKELRAVAVAAKELIARERHGDLCCLIANEYIERRKHTMGSKLIAVHLVIEKDTMKLYDAAHREITDKYSAYIPIEDRPSYSQSDLVLSAMVDIAPRSIYVYGGENNLKMLRRVQLMFTGVKLMQTN